MDEIHNKNEPSHMDEIIKWKYEWKWYYWCCWQKWLIKDTKWMKFKDEVYQMLRSHNMDEYTFEDEIIYLSMWGLQHI
jgi:hypothetical protein